MSQKRFNSIEFWPGTRKNISFKNTVLDPHNFKILQQTHQEMKHELIMAGTRGVTGVRVTIFFTEAVNPTPYQGFQGKVIKKIDRRNRVKNEWETDLDCLTNKIKEAKLSTDEMNNLPRLMAQQLIDTKRDFEQLKADIEKNKPQIQKMTDEIKIKAAENLAMNIKHFKLAADEAALIDRIKALKSVEGINYETYITYRGKKFKSDQLERELKLVSKEKISIKSSFKAPALNIIPVTRLKYTKEETDSINDAWKVFDRVKKQDPDLIDSSGSEFNEDYSDDDSDD
jgi:predicted DNA binding CopG/RHH family protein